MSGPRFLFYSHDGFGLGHFHRNLILSRAVTDLCREASVLLACGAEGLETFSLPAGVDLLRLPGLRKVDNDRYTGRRLSLEASEIVSLRAGLLSSAVEYFRPDVVLADKHPVGVYEELLPALRLLHAHGGRAAVGLRDVLDDPDATAAEWFSAGLDQRVAELHDMVLIYGSRGVLNPLTPGLLPTTIAERLHFCGYVVGRLPAVKSPPPDLPNGGQRPVVLASAGGGEDGAPMLKAFIEACEGAPWQGAIVAGPQMAALEWADLETRAARAGVLAYRAVPQVQRWFPHADALVCMGGYNSLLEAVSSGTATVCVPRSRPRREQLIRARAFAAMGLVEVVEPEGLTVERLALAVQTALRTPRTVVADRARATLEVDGARRAAALLLHLALSSGPAAPQPVQLGAT